MSQTTKRALEASLKKLLLKKPLNKITINDITEDCGVNRMTFYYHFKDIYDLVDWILVEDAAKVMEGRRTFDTWSEAFYQLLQEIQSNKTLVLNVYRSMSREQVEVYLYKMVDPLLREFVDREAVGMRIAEADKQFVVDFYKYAMVGIVLEWIRKDMKEEPAAITERLNTMMRGDLHRSLSRFRADRPTEEG
ncbi:MAG: TetR-like C-terminal domain-containing protein [Faecalibacterium sp.]